MACIKFTKKDLKYVLQIFNTKCMVDAFYLDLFKKMYEFIQINRIRKSGNGREKSTVSIDNSTDIYQVSDIVKYIERHHPDLLNTVSLTECVDTGLVDRSSELRQIVDIYILESLQANPTKTLNKLAKIHSFTEDEIIEMIPERYASFDSFVVIGCPESTDIDVVCFVRSSDQSDGDVKDLSPSTLEDLLTRLKKLGYDTSRDVDINCVYVDPATKTITASSKGGCETQNIINSTWMYHAQEIDQDGVPYAMNLHPVNMVELDDEEMLNKLRSCAKYVLDYAEDITVYKKFRPIKIEICSQGGDMMMKTMKEIMNFLVHDPADVDKEGLNRVRWHDRYKAIVMKLIQITSYDIQKKTAYAKRELIDLLNNVLSDKDINEINRYKSCARWYLFRGREGVYCSDLVKLLFDRYNEIVDRTLRKFDVIPQTYPIESIKQTVKKSGSLDNISSDLLDMFLNTPEKATDEFIDRWTAEVGDKSVNQMFPIKSSDEAEFYDRYKSLDTEVLDLFKRHFIFVDQRSDRWLDMLNNRFICGRNSVDIDESSYQSKYNLIRGAILEKFAIDLFDADASIDDNSSDMQKWVLGFIVESDAIGSKGISPDIVVISDNGDTPELIIIEIKGLKSMARNTDYYRGYFLASKQTRSARDLLYPYIGDKLLMKRGVVLLCCVEDEVFKMELHKIEFT